MTLTLKNDKLVCDINPGQGACIAGLWHNHIPVLRSTPGAQLQSVRECASYPLVPYSNRQAFAQFRWQGQQFSLAKNFDPEPHAIHGVGWQRPWQLAPHASSPDMTTSTVTLTLEHTPDGSWPFAFSASQTISLHEDALELRMAVTNRASVAAPAGLGWHPYFAKHASDHLTFEAQGRWEMDADKLPTRRLPNPGLRQDCAALSVDHCFDGWGGKAVLRNARFVLTITSDLTCLVVFTRPERDNIAIEPVSHVNNALNLVADGVATAQALGVRLLEPGETFAAHMRIAIEAV